MRHAQQRLASREWRTWAKPRKGLSLATLVAKLQADGVPVIEVDEANNRVLVAYERQEFQ